MTEAWKAVDPVVVWKWISSRGDCIIPISNTLHTCTLHTVGCILSHAFKCPHSQRQTVLRHTEMCSFEVHAMWCTEHSQMDFQAVSNSHSHKNRIINSVFQFLNAPENFSWSDSKLRGQRWHYEKLHQLDSQNGSSCSRKSQHGALTPHIMNLWTLTPTAQGPCLHPCILRKKKRDALMQTRTEREPHSL